MNQKSDQQTERSMPFIRMNERPPKPRQRGITEIRRPYYTPMGKRYLSDILETMGTYVDSLKYAGGSFSLMPRQAVKELNDLCHANNVLVSTGAFIEYVLTQGPEWAIAQAKRYLEAGAYMIMIESEGITESVETWRMDVPAKVVSALGLEKVMFEAADPAVFAWYIKNYGSDVNLFVDHSQIVQLECLRSGIWGTKSLWGRVITFKENVGQQQPVRRSASAG